MVNISDKVICQPAFCTKGPGDAVCILWKSSILETFAMNIDSTKVFITRKRGYVLSVNYLPAVIFLL